MNDKMEVFNEQKLREEIAKTWGEHGAHIEVFDMLLKKASVSGGLALTFEQCLREEFLINTQNYPKEYHKLFQEKFERAERRFREQSGNDR